VLRTKLPSVLEIARIRSSNQDALRPFYHRLFELLTRNTYLPQNIYNYDETSLRTDAASKRKYVISSEISSLSVEERRSITSITLGMTVAANGSRLPGLLLMDTKARAPIADVLPLITENVLVLSTQNGWITKETFCQYMRSVVIPSIVARKNMTFSFFLEFADLSDLFTILS
jgi:hypothetical protein